jgi:uncharacterized protein YbbC (DUF1343 family)
MRLMQEIRRAHPAEFQWRCSTSQDGQQGCSLDRLAGSSRIRAAIENGTLDALLAEWDRDAQRFLEMRRPYLLY